MIFVWGVNTNINQTLFKSDFYELLTFCLNLESVSKRVMSNHLDNWSSFDRKWEWSISNNVKAAIVCVLQTVKPSLKRGINCSEANPQPTWQPVNTLKAWIYRCFLSKFTPNLDTYLQHHSYFHGPGRIKNMHRVSVNASQQHHWEHSQQLAHSSSFFLEMYCLVFRKTWLCTALP